MGSDSHTQGLKMQGLPSLGILSLAVILRFITQNQFIHNSQLRKHRRMSATDD